MLLLRLSIGDTHRVGLKMMFGRKLKLPASPQEESSDILTKSDHSFYFSGSTRATFTLDGSDDEGNATESSVQNTLSVDSMRVKFTGSSKRQIRFVVI